MKKLVLFVTIISLFSAYNEAKAANVPADINIGGGVINNHDMMMLREKQRLHDEKIDIENFNNKKHDFNENVINTNDIFESDFSDKIYNAETSQKLKERRESIENSKKKHRFSLKKNKSEVANTDSKKKITTDDNETLIQNEESKPQFVDGKLYIKGVQITNSKILSDFEIQEITDTVIGKYASFEELNKLVQDINYAYAVKGYVTAKAFLAPQTIQDGIVKVTLVEGSVGEINVYDNKYTSSEYIKKRLSAKTGDIFQIMQLEQEVVAFNRNNQGVRLNANLKKGKQEGTTDIDIKAEEKFPFHVVGIMDNAGRKTIGELRGGLMMYSDSLFKQRDRLTIGSYASRHSITPYADYNIPVNRKDGRVGFTFSTSYSEIGEGPYKIFDINSRSYNYALYYSHPLIRTPKFELTSYTAANYKEASTSFGKYRLNTDQVTSLETSLSARYDSKRGIWYITQGVYQAFPLFDENSKYFKYTGSLIRFHDFGHGIVGQLKGMYQYSPKDVMPYLDQFQAGGLATVRGYSEGLLIGRSGYILSAELMFPILPSDIPIKKKGEKKKVPFLGRFVKGIAFVDHAGIYPFKGEGPGSRSYNKDDYMVSTGFGLRVSLPGDASARLYWGYPLMRNNHETYYRKPRFSFEISLAPDIDRILKWKREKQERENL